MVVFLLDLLRTAVAQHLDVPEAEVPPDADLVADLALDSLDLLEIAEAVESGIGVDIPSEVWDAGSTLAQLAKALEGMLADRGSSM